LGQLLTVLKMDVEEKQASYHESDIALEMALSIKAVSTYKHRIMEKCRGRGMRSDPLRPRARADPGRRRPARFDLR
jgi:hypothetical protein